MADAEEAQVSEAQIAVHWREEEYYEPPASFVAQANAADPAIFARFSEERFPECFKEYADLLTWDAQWHTTLDTSNPPFWKWFVGGRLNACVNCVDRHLATSADKPALIWVPEPEDEETKEITYQALFTRIFASCALRCSTRCRRASIARRASCSSVRLNDSICWRDHSRYWPTRLMNS
jgi:acetyl-CoA synthetase